MAFQIYQLVMHVVTELLEIIYQHLIYQDVELNLVLVVVYSQLQPQDTLHL